MLRSSNSIPPRMPKEMTIMAERYIRAIMKTLPFQPSFPILGVLAMSSLLSLFLFLSFARDTQAAPGDLDPSFGTGGKVLTNFSGCSNCTNSNDGANAAAIQTDGKIVAAGFSSTFEPDFALARYNIDGSLDTTFGSSGTVTISLSPGGINIVNAVAIDTEDKIVVAGVSTVSGSGSQDFSLIRLNTDGSLDTSFGSGGKVTTEFGDRNSASANAIAIQADNKIVVAGSSFVNGLSDFALARYNTDGSLDTSFGTGGMVLTDFNNGNNDVANALAIQKDGKIILAGFSNAIGSDGFLLAADFALARYNTDGSLDTSFGIGGKLLTNFIFIGAPSNGGDDAANAVAIQTDGKIVAAGFFKLPVGGTGLPTGGGFALARYNTDGSLDPSFGSGGNVITVFSGNGSSDVANGIAIQSDGKIVAAGVSLVNGSDEFALARYDTDGSLDPSFGIEGKVLTDFGNGSNDAAKAVVIQADDKIVAAGSAGSVSSFSGAFALARYIGIGNTPSPNNNGGGCSIVGSVETETGVANLIIPLIPVLAISLRMLIRRKKDV
jgi:uncharacterized delta-60 repeat protein